MAAVDIDASEWPIVVISPPSNVSDAELDDYFEVYERTVLARRERFSIVLDLRRSTGMPPKQRKMLTDRMKAQDDRTRQYIAVTVLVFESAVMRALLTAVLWMRKPTSEMRVASTRHEATVIVREMMASSAALSARG